MFFVFLFFFRLINLFLIVYFIINNIVFFFEWEIISFNSVRIVISILLDWISLLFIIFVLIISSVVIYYRKSYIRSELNLFRFIILVLLFVLSIILLIIRPNIIRILLGWDGLGLVSYCLVIYYQNLKSYNAGILTVLSNRIGDVLILIVISWILNYGSWNYIFYLNFITNDLVIEIIGLIIIIASITKRAQIPFSSWLPAAIAAPTPVSALVHSSTLVTAGVYLLIRFNLLILNTFFIKILLLLGIITIFIAGISANYEFDLKKIIALSTLRQLGLIIRILRIGFPDLAFFHLLTHAIFKALLFICAGVIIHMMNDIQDIRYMGGIRIYLPLTSLCLNISNIALCGIPFLAGFYSKDLILEIVSFRNLNIFVFFFYYVSTGLTIYYTIRLLIYLIINDFNLLSVYNLYDEDFVILNRIFLLLFMRVVRGRLLRWIIFYYPYIIYLPYNLKIIVIYVRLLGGLIGFLVRNINIYRLNKFLITYNLRRFLCLMWFIPTLSTYGVRYYFLNYGQNLLKILDIGWREIYSGQGIVKIIKKYSIFYIIFQINNLKIYLFRFILWIIIYIYILFINIYLNSL